MGALNEGSGAKGINGNQTDNSASRSGAVYVFTRSGSTWSQQAYIKASNTALFDAFGDSVNLSNDGNTLAVSATGEDSSATGINGNQGDNSASFSGAVYVFMRSGSTWSQQAYLKASNTAAGDAFGRSVSLANDGNTLVVGASGEDSSATGINGDQTDNSASSAGAVYVFTRSGSTWLQQAYLKASNTETRDGFGRTVELSGDGSTLVVGATGENSSATGINGDQTDNSASFSGAVYVFMRSGSTWSQQAYIKASNTAAFNVFGISVDLNDDGNMLAVAASREGSNARGINGNQADNSAANAGAVYMFTRSGNSWSHQAYIKASNSEASNFFGRAVSLNDAGNTLAIGASAEDSNAIGYQW